jgi:hypothetical protein
MRSNAIVSLNRFITQSRHQFDPIVILTTAPVAKTFFLAQDISELFKLDAIADTNDTQRGKVRRSRT